MKEVNILIVGAGLSGLVLGSELSKLQKNFLIIEKSPGLGGRIATRRLSEQPFDHGVLYLKPDPYLLNLHVSLFLTNALCIGDEGIFTSGGMTRLPKVMAENLPIRKNVKAERLIRGNDLWKVECENGDQIIAKKIILTAPLPQSLELLDKSELDLEIPENARSISYSKAVIGLFQTDMPFTPRVTDPEIETLCPLASRISSGKGIIMHMSEDWSEDHFALSDEILLETLTRKLKACFNKDLKISEAQIKRWKYRTPKDVLPLDYMELSNDLFLIGDAFRYPDVRGSVHSALSALRAMV